MNEKCCPKCWLGGDVIKQNNCGCTLCPCHSKEGLEGFINEVWEVLKSDSNDLRKQKKILELTRSLLESAAVEIEGMKKR
jgi:hypothetical protein